MPDLGINATLTFFQPPFPLESLLLIECCSKYGSVSENLYGLNVFTDHVNLALLTISFITYLFACLRLSYRLRTEVYMLVLGLKFVDSISVERTSLTTIGLDRQSAAFGTIFLLLDDGVGYKAKGVLFYDVLK